MNDLIINVNDGKSFEIRDIDLLHNGNIIPYNDGWKLTTLHGVSVRYSIYNPNDVSGNYITEVCNQTMVPQVLLKLDSDKRRSLLEQKSRNDERI